MITREQCSGLNTVLLKFIKMETFSKALTHIQSGGGNFAKRDCIKNDTFIIEYKKRLYHFSKNTGIRYPYIPSNKDLRAKDWVLFKDGIELKPFNQNYAIAGLRNLINEGGVFKSCWEEPLYFTSVSPKDGIKYTLNVKDFDYRVFRKNGIEI